VSPKQKAADEFLWAASKVVAESRFLRALDIDRDFFWMEVDASKGNLLYVSEAFRNRMGYSYDEIQSKQFIDLIHPDDVKMTADFLTKIKSQNTDPYDNIVNRYRDQSGHYHSIWWYDSHYSVQSSLTLIHGFGRFL
jgi:PAS domain S-box-containing protein